MGNLEQEEINNDTITTSGGEVINESIEDVSDIIEPVAETLAPGHTVTAQSTSDKVAIRMTSGYKGRKGGDDYLVTKKELKAIPIKKYKLI